MCRLRVMWIILFMVKRELLIFMVRRKVQTPDTIKKLDNGLRNFARIVREKYGKDISRLPGAGAAGGLGAGAVVFLNASLRSGIELVMDITGFEEHLKTPT